MAKLKATEMLAFVADEAIQIHGGMGLMDDLPLERIWRDARVERIWEGTSEIQRHIISRALLAAGRGMSLQRALERLLRPRSIAVFGGVQAAAVVAACIKMGFAGDIWPVHPTRRRGARHPAFRSVAELPGAPDAAFVGVNRAPHASR